MQSAMVALEDRRRYIRLLLLTVDRQCMGVALEVLDSPPAMELPAALMVVAAVAAQESQVAGLALRALLFLNGEQHDIAKLPDD
jgi:hypothetical protein